MGNTWPMVPLEQVLAQSSEVVEIEPDRRYRQVTVRLWGGGVVLRNELSGARISAKKRRVARAEQFILSRIDARNGAFGLVPESLEGAVVSNDFPSFNINRQSLEPRFLEWMSKTEDFVKLCRAASEGTTNRVRLQVDRFLATPIPLPPLDEQRRIVARIEELAALIDEAQELRAKAREEAEKIMHAALARLFARPGNEGWVTEKLDQVADTATGGTPSRSRDEYFGGDIPWVKSAELRDTIIEATEERLTDAGLRNSSAKTFPSGTVLVAMYGANVGKTGILGLPAATNQAVCAVFPHEEDLDKRFVYYFFRWKRPELLASSFGGAQPNISQKFIKASEIPFPYLVEEQRRIVTYLDGLQAQVDELTALHDATQVELDALLPSVLDRAFKGDL